jgi:hypothetical protein
MCPDVFILLLILLVKMKAVKSLGNGKKGYAESSRLEKGEDIDP